MISCIWLSYFNNLFMYQKLRLGFIVLASFAIILGLITPANSIIAAEFFFGEGSLPVNSINTNENWYAAGNTLLLDQTIGGDAYTAGNAITVIGKIGGDFVSAGSILTLASNISGDARLAASTVNLNSVIEGDTIIAAAQIIQGRNSILKGDARLYAGEITLNGLITKPISIKAETVVINGTLARGGSIFANKLIFGSQAQVNGVINYQGKNAAVIENNSKVLPEQIKFTEYQRGSEGYVIAGLTLTAIGFWLLKVAVMVFTSWLFTTLWPKFTYQVVIQSRKDLWTSVGVGLLTVIVLPIASFISIATLFGSVFGFVGLILLVLLGIFAQVLAGPLVGHLISEKASWFGTHLDWKQSVGGTLILQVIGAIPVIGWIAKGLMQLSVIGVVAMQVKDHYWTGRN